MVGECVLAVDCGTSGIKYALIGHTGPIITFEKIEERPIRQGIEGAQKWDPGEAIANLAKCLFKASIAASAQRLSIKGLALTTTTSTLVCTERGLPLPTPPPLRWDDRQSEAEAETISKLNDRTGAFPWLCPVTPDTGIAKALLLSSRYPHVLIRPEVCILEHWSYANRWLTGVVSQCEAILARKWGLTNARPWNTEFVELLLAEVSKNYKPSRKQQPTRAGVPPESLQWFKEKFLPGPALAAGEEVGKLRRAVADMVNLPSTTCAYAAPFDTIAQIMGLGVVAPSDILAVSFGTSLGVCSAMRNDADVKWGCFGPIPSIPTPDAMMVFDGVASCGSAIDYVCSQFGLWKDQHPDYDRVQEALGTTQPGAQGVRMLPYFGGGRRTTIAKADRGSIRGLGLGVDERQVIRALYESLAYLVRLIIEDLQAWRGREFTEVRVGGGATRCRGFVELLAHVANRPVRACKYVDTALLGAGMCAACGCGLFASLSEAADLASQGFATIAPDPMQANLYEELYGEYRDEYGSQIQVTRSPTPRSRRRSR